MSLTTETMDGEPVRADTDAVSTLRLEGGLLVAEDTGKRVYLRRQ